MKNLDLNKDEFLTRINELRDNLSFAKFAEKCGLPLGAINSIMNGSMPSAERAFLIANTHGKTVEWLLTGDTANAEQSSDSITVPHYDVRASAGNGQLVLSESIDNQITFQKQWLKQFVANPETVGIIQAEGDSMMKEYGDGIVNGDLLMVDTAINYFSQNGVYVIDVNGNLLVKRLELLPTKSVMLISDNPRYSSQEITNRSSRRYKGYWPRFLAWPPIAIKYGIHRKVYFASKSYFIQLIQRDDKFIY